MGGAIEKQLLSNLVELNFAPPEALAGFSGHGSLSELEDSLISSGVITPAQITQAHAFELGLRFVQLADERPADNVFDVIPFELCKKFQVVPLAVEERVIELVVEDPYDIDLQHRIEFLTQRRVRIHVSDSDSIAKALSRMGDRYDSVKDVADGLRLEIIVEDGDENKSLSLDEYGEFSGSPIVRLINTIIVTALKKRASDIHVEVFDYGIEVKYRIDGILYPATERLASSYHATLISRLKVMGELDIAEKRTPQDGRFKLKVYGREVDFRLSIIPTSFGENAVIRVLDNLAGPETGTALSLDTLGFNSAQLKAFRRAVHEPYGMILIAGPTGSGKTTSIYAALTEINSGQEKIITIEDPVEYKMEGVMQIAVNEKKGLTFSAGLRSVLRHDPDKILVGEIRDAETASIAVRSALTGHLVFSTVHANSSIDVISRFQNMGIDIFNFISSLNCVVAQRLLRVLCERCKQPVKPDSEYLLEMGLDEHQLDHPLFGPVGCDECGGTGYRGRTSICEVLMLNDEIRHRILQKGSVYEALGNSDLCDSLTLRKSAIALALRGVSSMDEVNRVTFIE